MKWIRKILKGASLTTALFIFQACYGTAGVDLSEIMVDFKVVSAVDGKPLKGVEVSARDSKLGAPDWKMLGYTDEEGWIGLCQDYIGADNPEFRFKAADYHVKDTVIIDCYGRDIEIKLTKTE